MKRWILLGLFVTGCAQTDGGSATATANAAEPNKAEGAQSTDGMRLPAGEVVAKWEGGEITYGELHESAAGELRKMRTDYLTKVNELERRALDQKVVEALVESAAEKAGTTSEAYMRGLAPEDVDVTDEEIQKFYDQQVKGRQPMEQVRPRIVAFLKSRAQQEAVRKAVDELKEKAKVSVTLPAPEIPKAEFELAGRPFKGPADAKVTVVEFSDFECPYCSRAAGPTKALVDDNEGVKVYFLHFPLSFHKQAMPSAIAAECAHAQGKFWEMHDKLFDNQTGLAEDKYPVWAKEIGLDMAKYEGCVADPATKARVEADMAMGQKAGVGGTPSFYINGVQHRGVPDDGVIKAALDS
ncbi:MAG: thioredoxin domain-containing protein [Myxococcota bacterium]